MTNQALIPAENTLPAVMPPTDYVPVAGFESVPADDFSLPTLKLVQAQTKNEGAVKHQGEYIKTDTGDYLDGPNVLVVGIAKTRIMFPDKYAADNKALCRSDDGNYPRPEYIGTVVNRVTIDDEGCAACPFSKWPEDGKTPPACKLADNWAVILPTGDPAILRLSGSSAKTSATLKNIMRANRFAGRATHVKLGSRFEQTAQGQFFVATIAPAQDAIAPAALNTAKMLAGVNLAARAAAEEQDAPTRSVEPPADENDGFNQYEQQGRPF